MRVSQIVAEGTKGAVLMFMAAPRETDGGGIEMDVSTYVPFGGLSFKETHD